MANLTFLWRRTIVSDVVQGIIAGGVLAFVSTILIVGAEVKAIQTTVNGWSTSLQCGTHSGNILHRAACAQVLPATNLPQEAVYWTTTVDGSGQTLSGQHDYVLHFPAGQLPPNEAFWSLTMADPQNRFVRNPIDRYSVGDRSGLVPNADGSVDIYLQNTAPAGHESNWLPAPAGGFKLWLRVYRPGASILDGTYKVPPVAKTQ